MYGDDWTYLLSKQVGLRLRRVVCAEALPITPTMAAKLHDLELSEEQLGATAGHQGKDGDEAAVPRKPIPKGR